MYKRILSAVNEFLYSEIAAKYALHLAKECNAKLYLCFIAGKGLYFNRADEALKRLFLTAFFASTVIRQVFFDSVFLMSFAVAIVLNPPFLSLY